MGWVLIAAGIALLILGGVDVLTGHKLSPSLPVRDWVAIAAVVIAVGSVLIAYQGNRQSEESNRAAKEANTIALEAVAQAKQALIQAERPWLSADVVKNSDGHYLEIVRRDDHIELRTRFKLRNTGRSAAKRISLPEIAMLRGGHRVQVVADAKYEAGPTIDLAPDTSEVLAASTLMKHEDLDALEDDLQGDNYTAVVGLTWRYGSALDTSQRYKTTLHVQLRVDRAKILRLEME